MGRTRRAGIAIAVMALAAGLVACATTEAPAGPAQTAAKPVARPASRQGTRPEFPGFRRVVRNDTEYFCQSRSPTGSRARVGEQCFTRDELKQMEENSRDMFKDAGGGSSHDSLRMDSPR